MDMHRKHQKQTKKRIHDMYQGPNIDISVILLINYSKELTDKSLEC